MTKQEAILLKEKYSSIVIGKPLSKDTPQFIIKEIKVREISENNYDVTVSAPTDEGVVNIYRPLHKFLKENNL